MAVSSSSVHPLHQTLPPKCPLLPRNVLFLRQPVSFSYSHRFPSTIRACSAVALEPELSTKQNLTSEEEPFSCPVCYEPLIRKGPSGFNLSSIYRSGFKCKTCNKTYSSKDNYLDLTIAAALKNYTEVQPARTEVFRSPIVSFLYERGWRQFFRQSGFPGADEEFKMAQEFFEPAAGGLLVDVSCGSGLFTRKFAKSETYSKVIALDFSENMLRQCYDFIKQDSTISTAPLSNLMFLMQFKMAQEFFEPAAGGLLVDVSCGSGLFTRKFAKSETYSKVIALDFSENMLRQCYDFIKQDSTISTANLALVRADVSRLPFSSGSVDAVHAGAAMHCWASPPNALAEICRVLRSGGVFVGSTFLRYSSTTPWIELPFRERLLRMYSYFLEEEIDDLCRSCGLINYTAKVDKAFIMFSAKKP